MNLSAGAGIAVREFGTGAGPADYALFIDKEFCGVIEAKPAGTTLSGFADQAARYISGAPEWLGVDPKKRRFEYVASDTEILFRDHGDPEPRSRRSFRFPSTRNPPTLAERAGDVAGATAPHAAARHRWSAHVPGRSDRWA